MGMRLFIIVLTVCLAHRSLAEEKYTQGGPSPATGYKSAVKYFTGKSRKSASRRTPQGNKSFSFESYAYVDNDASQVNRVSDGDWGGQLGLYWDQQWMSRGLNVEYANYGDDNKLAVLAGLVFPRMRSSFPLYVKGSLGLGYFVGQDVARETLTFDYNIFTGFKYSSGSWLFNVEVGSKNYTKLLENAYLNSVVLSSGISILF